MKLNMYSNDGDAWRESKSEFDINSLLKPILMKRFPQLVWIGFKPLSQCCSRTVLKFQVVQWNAAVLWVQQNAALILEKRALQCISVHCKGSVCELSECESGLNPITVYHSNHPRPPLRGRNLLRNALNYTYLFLFVHCISLNWIAYLCMAAQRGGKWGACK